MRLVFGQQVRAQRVQVQALGHGPRLFLPVAGEHGDVLNAHAAQFLNGFRRLRLDAVGHHQRAQQLARPGHLHHAAGHIHRHGGYAARLQQGGVARKNFFRPGGRGNPHAGQFFHAVGDRAVGIYALADRRAHDRAGDGVV